MAFFTDPECQEVVVRGRQLTDGKQLDPPGDWPVVFSCKYHGVDSIGCVFLNGAVMVMPNRCSRQAGPCGFCHFGAVEHSTHITDIRFNWQVTKSAEEVSQKEKQ